MATDAEKLNSIYSWVQANPDVLSKLNTIISTLAKLDRIPSDLTTRLTTISSTGTATSTKIDAIKTAIGDKSEAKTYGLDGSHSLVALEAKVHQALVEKPLSVDLKYNGPTVTEIADEFTKRGDSLVSKVEELSSDLLEKNDSASQAIKTLVGDSAAKYESSLDSYIKKISGQMTYLQTVQNQVETTRTAITAAVSDLAKVCTNLQTATATIVDLSPVVLADKQKVGETLLTVEGLTTEVANISNLLSDFKSQVGSFANLLASQQSSTETLAQAIQATKAVVSDSLAERERHNVVTEAFDAVKGAVTQAFDEATKVQSANTQALTDSVEKALDTTSKVVTHSLGSVQESVGACFDNVKDNMQSCFNNVTASLRSVAAEQTKRVDTLAQTYSKVEQQRSKDGNISLAVDTALRTPEMLESIKRLVKKEVDL